MDKRCGVSRVVLPSSKLPFCDRRGIVMEPLARFRRMLPRYAKRLEVACVLRPGNPGCALCSGGRQRPARIPPARSADTAALVSNRARFSATRDCEVDGVAAASLLACH